MFSEHLTSSSQGSIVIYLTYHNLHFLISPLSLISHTLFNITILTVTLYFEWISSLVLGKFYYPKSYAMILSDEFPYFCCFYDNISVRVTFHPFQVSVTFSSHFGILLKNINKNPKLNHCILSNFYLNFENKMLLHLFIQTSFFVFVAFIMF